MVQSSGTTQCHAMASGQTSCIQPRLTAMRFSWLLTIKESAQTLNIMSHDNVLKAAIQWFRQQPKQFFAEGKY